MGKLEQWFRRLRKLVLALSGAHEEVLGLVPSERARFESLGWAILITSGVAAVSMWFALASAVGINGILALPIALAWGLVIMGIDRWLIVSMPIEGRRKFAIAVPRLALALLLGTLISTPLVLRVFQSEINAQIAKIQQDSFNTFLKQQQASDVAKQVSTFSGELNHLNNVIATHGAATSNTASDPQLVAYSKQLTNLSKELTHWTSLKGKYYHQYTCQLYGGPACPKKGFGPAAKDSKKSYQDASKEVSTIKGQINQVQGNIAQRDHQLTSHSKADQQARYQQALTQQPIVKSEYQTALRRQNDLQEQFFTTSQASHGLLIRLEALSQLSNGNFTVTAARFLLFLLFLVIECLPVTVKLLQRPGVYEEALGHAQNAERRDASKFYQFRSRISSGPGGATVLRAEPESRVHAIWTPTRALLGPSDPSEPDDDPPTRPAGDEGPPPSAPGGGPGYDRPGPQWHGGDRWRDNWHDERPADSDPPAATARRESGMSRSGSGGRGPGPDEGPATVRAGDWPGTGHVPDETYGDKVRPDLARGQHDHEADERAGDHAPASTPPGGGVPLSWDDDE